MIVEGIVTTLSPDGSVHIAPMGPDVDADFGQLILKPYQTSQTYQNLVRHPEGVFHVTDDVLLLAQAAIGQIDPLPAFAACARIQGSYLCESCRYFEFRVLSSDTAQTRTRLQAEVLLQGRLRDFLGFNRGKHAVVEAAILATRLHILSLNEIDREFNRLEVLVGKTGGPSEHEAFRLLRSHLDSALRANSHAGAGHEGKDQKLAAEGGRI